MVTVSDALMLAYATLKLGRRMRRPIGININDVDEERTSGSHEGCPYDISDPE